jgi:hypothetical protein
VREELTHLRDHGEIRLHEQGRDVQLSRRDCNRASRSFIVRVVDGDSGPFARQT